MFRTKTQQLAEMLEGVTPPAEGAFPPSALKSLRGSRPQATVAAKAGITQAALSRLEAGERTLNPEAAKKLGPALGVSPTDLLAADQVARLHHMSIKGQLDPRTLLAAIEELAWTLPAEEVGEDLVDAMLGILKRAIETYGEGVATVATKSKGPEGTRDSQGRKIRKPHDPNPAARNEDQDPEGPRRDKLGRRLSKPNDPRRGR